MFNGSLNTFAKAETAYTDYLGWNNSGTNLPSIKGPVEIYQAYAGAVTYTYTVNGNIVTPNTTEQQMVVLGLLSLVEMSIVLESSSSAVMPNCW